MSLNPSTLRKFTHFPKSGSVLGAFDVKEATINLENNTWFVMFDGDVKRKQAREAMKHFVGKPKHIPLNQKGSSLVCVELVCSEVTSVRSNPNGRVTIAKGHLMFPTVRHNPTAAIDFKHEMRDMITDNPEKSFKKYSYSRLNDKDFLDQLWSFVSWSGESYGWVTRDRKIYHRRASLIMPKIKISKRPDNEVAFYHTHPSKDEPSLTSADDIQFYLDLSFEPGIKHHYTVMRDRIDYFKFKVRNNRLQKYLDMDEARFVADVDAMIDVAEKEVKKDNLDPVDHCFEVTKKVVQKFNQKFKGIASITYKQFVKPDYLPEDVVNPFGEALANPGPINNPSLFREVSPEEFVSARKYAKRRAFLSPHSAKHIRETNTKAYLSTDNLTGYLIDPTGDLQNLFNIGKAGQGALAVRDAISRGVISVDAFGPFLPKYYAQFGFEEWGRYKWDDNYAPRDWDYSTYGRPDVVFMKLPGVKINPSIGNYPRPNPGPVIPEKYDHRVLNDLKGLDYDWVHYGGDEFAHTTYVHWWMKHYFGPATRTRPQSLYKLEPIGFDKELRGKTRDYLSTVFANNWTYLDMLYLVGIYHDSGKKVQKDGGPHHSMAAKNMWDDFIADELDVPHAMEEAVSLMFESDIGRRGISEGFFQTLTGDYYGIAVIMQLADIATHHPYMYTSIAEQYRKAGDFSGNVEQFKDWWMRQHVEKLRTFLNKPRKNPKPVPLMVRWRGSYETPISPRLAEALLEAYSQENVEDEDGKKGKKFMATVGSGYLRFNTDNLGLLTGKIPENSVVKAQLGFSTGNLTISFSRKNAPKDAGKEVAQIIYEHVGDILRGAIPDVVIDTEVETNVQTNPRKMKANVIIVCGPSGVGKSTFIRYLKKNLDGVGEPLTWTSRPRRPKERKGIDKNFVTKERFLEMIEDGEFVEWDQQGGHYYGRRFADFNYKYNVLDVNLRGMRKFKKVFPNAHTIFLKPDVSPKSLLRRLLRRGGMTYEEAKSRVRKAKPMIEQAKTMDFDQIVMIREDRFEEDFATIIPGIPIANPSRTPEGRKIPKKYLKGLNREEMAIAAKEIDKGYKYDADDPEAYEEWKSDIKAKARGYKTVPSKYKKKFIEMYGPLPEKGKFIDKVAKATKIKKSILQKVYDKGLAAWATGHRVGVAPHQWATGRVYSFVTLGNTVKKGNKKMPDYSLAVEAGLVKDNPPKKITVSYVRNHPDTLFVFGDNDQRTGKGGQAVIRDEPNAIGVRTKKAPKTSAAAYYTDNEYKKNIAKIKADFAAIKKARKDYDTVYFIPGIGEGRAKLEEKAPKTYAWLKGNLPKSVKMSCPPATQDLELNTKNRDAAVKAEHIQYGPLNLSDKDYWVRYAERWNTTPAVAKKSNCSNCIAFDISPRMKDCMPGKTSDKDGELGYCWMHHFKCHSARSCYTWAKGGPISKDKVSHEWQERAFPLENPPRPIPEFGFHFTHKDNLDSIMEKGLRGRGGEPVFLFYPDSDYWGWIITGQIDGVWDTWNPGPEEVASKIDEVIMLKVKFDKNAFRPVEYVNDEELHDEFMVEGTIPPKNIEFMGNLQDGISQTYASTPIDNPPDPFFPGDAVKKYPWLRHADLIQQNSPGTLPPRLVVIGERDGKKVVVFAGRPYYQSTGTSPASGTGATKRKGEWYGFAGIEPDKGKWFPNEAGEWWIKGNGPGIPPFASVVLDRNTGFYEPKREGRFIKTHEHKFGHFPQIRSAREMNELLAQHGFIAPIRGKYPSEVPVSAPAPGSLRAQAMQFRSNPPAEWPVGLRYLSADRSVEEQYPGIHNHPLGPITLWHGSPHAKRINSFVANGLVPAIESGLGSEAGGQSDPESVSLTPYRWEAHGYAGGSSIQYGPNRQGSMILTPQGRISLMIGVRGSLLEHPDYTTRIGATWDSMLMVPHVPPEYIEVFGYIHESERYIQPEWVREQVKRARLQDGEDLDAWTNRLTKEPSFSVPASKLKGPAFNPKEGPDLFSYFERWAKLVNMKNKELKAFLDSPLGKTAGLSPQEAKEQGIFSGRVSGRRILKMREKIGLGGPKDYIKGPRHLEEKWEVALNKWTGPSKDYMNGTTDWDWCMRQVRFNTRHGAFPYNHNAEDRKGPLIKKQKTQNKVSRRLLGLWVWGHDPWRWARKHGVERMPKCPDVPWVGMTEKRKYGKVPVVMNPKVKTNPHMSPVSVDDEGVEWAQNELGAWFYREAGDKWKAWNEDHDLEHRFEEYPYESMKREFDDWVANNTSPEGKQEQTLKYASAMIQLPEFKKKYPNGDYIKFVLAGDSPFAETLYIIPKKQFTRKVKKWGKKYGAELVKINPHGGAHRVPQKYKGQPMDEHSDLYVNEKEENTIEGLGFKDRATAIKSVNIIKRSGKTHAHKIQAAMAMEQRARFHPNATPGIKAAQKVYAKFIEEMKKKTKSRKNPSDERNPFEEYRKAQDYRNELDYHPLMEDITDKQRAEWFRRDKIMKSLEQEIVDTYGREIFNDAFGGYYVPPHRALYRIENEDLARYRIVGDRGEGTVLLENVDTKERRDYVPLSALRELHPDFKANPAPPQPNLNNLDSVRKHVEWVVRPDGEFSGDGIYIFDTRGIFQSSMYQRSPDYHRIIVRDGEPQLNTEWDRKVFAEGEEIEYYPKVVLTKFSNEFQGSLVNPSRHDWVDEEDDEILQMFEW